MFRNSDVSHSSAVVIEFACPFCNFKTDKLAYSDFPFTCACGAYAEAPGRVSQPTNKRRARGFGDTIANFTTAIGIKPCGGCNERKKTVNKWFPYSTADVLVLLTNGNPLWSLDSYFEAMGLTSVTVDLQNNKLQRVRELIKTVKPRLVINRSFCVGCDVVRTMAARYPKVNWVTINHSSQAHLLTQHYLLSAQCNFIRLAREFSNCWYASPDERNHLALATGCERIIYLPNNVDLPPEPTSRTPGSPAIVSLVGRRDVVKNWPTQIIAAGIANKTVPLQLLFVTQGNASDFEDMAADVGVESVSVGWTDQSKYLDLLRDHVDVALQASLSDSFNYVATDHLGLGIPVVGSPTIRYLPREWQADPNDAKDISTVLLLHIYNWKERSQQARAIAEDVSAVNRVNFNKAITRLCGATV